jgi:histidinol-phosphatase
MRVMVSNELQAALDAAAAAAEVIRAHYGRGIGVRIKPDTSPVTEADELAEEAIRGILSTRFPAFGFYGEESGQHDMDAAAIWIVDPIDGTKCFVREIPFFSTQIALWRGGRAVLGVSSAPVYGELAWAEEGAGAFLNGRPIRVSNIHELSHATVSTGNTKSLARSPAWLGLGRLVERAYTTRGYGDFVHYHLLARGALEIVIESDLNIYDIAALTVIIREAGGHVTDLAGKAVGLTTDSVLASNGPLHSEVCAMLSGART